EGEGGGGGNAGGQAAVAGGGRAPVGGGGRGPPDGAPALHRPAGGQRTPRRPTPARAGRARGRGRPAPECLDRAREGGRLEVALRRPDDRRLARLQTRDCPRPPAGRRRGPPAPAGAPAPPRA